MVCWPWSALKMVVHNRQLLLNVPADLYHNNKTDQGFFCLESITKVTGPSFVYNTVYQIERSKVWTRVTYQRDLHKGTKYSILNFIRVWMTSFHLIYKLFVHRFGLIRIERQMKIRFVSIQIPMQRELTDQQYIIFILNKRCHPWFVIFIGPQSTILLNET